MGLLLDRLNLIGFTRRDAAYNMALDRHLLDLGEAASEAASQEGYLRFYGWFRPALSLGHSEPLASIDREKVREDEIDMVRRPTGGRAVLHWDDLSYAVVLPAKTGKNLSELYKLISRCIIDGAGLMGMDLDFERGVVGKSGVRQKPCFASVSRYEISFQGRKVVGSAQRIGEKALLQHGSIPLNRNYLRIVDYMKCAELTREKIRQDLIVSTACLEDAAGRALDPLEVRAALVRGFSDRLGCAVTEIDASVFASQIEPPRSRLPGRKP